MPPSLAASVADGGVGGECGSQQSRSSFQHEQTPIRSAVDSVTYISDYFRKDEEDQQVCFFY